jgi:hypothetical protein
VHAGKSQHHIFVAARDNGIVRLAAAPDTAWRDASVSRWHGLIHGLHRRAYPVETARSETMLAILPPRHKVRGLVVLRLRRGGRPRSDHHGYVLPATEAHRYSLAGPQVVRV